MAKGIAGKSGLNYSRTPTPIRRPADGLMPMINATAQYMKLNRPCKQGPEAQQNFASLCTVFAEAVQAAAAAGVKSFATTLVNDSEFENELHLTSAELLRLHNDRCFKDGPLALALLKAQTEMTRAIAAVQTMQDRRLLP